MNAALIGLHQGVEYAHRSGFAGAVGAQQAGNCTILSAEADAIDRMPSEAVRNALAELPEERRLVVYFADVEGLSYQEIADIMGTPTGTVMSRLHRGRRELRVALTDYAREVGLLPSEGGDRDG
jgi:RNA polymerase sigma-70 factor (ECF subfamily)